MVVLWMGNVDRHTIGNGTLARQGTCFIIALAYSPSAPMAPSTRAKRDWALRSSRRDWLKSSFLVTTTLVASQTTAAFPALAKAPAAAEGTNPLPELLEAQTTLGALLENWKRATIDCTYADVPRELLEQKNKELLLEKATTYALFDKSVSVETCKTTNRIVRDYLGLTGKGPLVGMEKKLKRGMNFLDDVDDLDVYVSGT